MLYRERCVRESKWSIRRHNPRSIMDRAEKYNKFFIQDNEYLKSDEFKTPQI
jgi:hypothetical protein